MIIRSSREQIAILNTLSVGSREIPGQIVVCDAQGFTCDLIFTVSPLIR